MRLPLLRILLFASLWVGTTAAYASHIIGGELAFEPVDGSTNQYHIIARLYQDISSLQVIVGPSLTLICGRNSCLKTAPGSFTAELSLTQRRRSSLTCSSSPTYEMAVFEGIVTLPPARWTLSISQENRRSNSYNVIDSYMRDIHVEALLDNSSGLTDFSPKFTSFTLPYIMGNEVNRYSFSAFDQDGDSLVYSSVQPLASLQGEGECSNAISYSTSAGGEFVDPVTGLKVPYGPVQFTPAFPFLSYQVTNGTAVPFFQLNATTGELVTRSINLGSAIVAVHVDEYRQLGGSWRHIGSVTRDVTYLVLSVQENHNPTITEVKVAGAAASQPADRVIPVRPGQSVSLTLTAADPDAGQTLRLSSDVAATIPGASFQTLPNNQAQLSWQVPAELPLGRYSFTVTVADNSCPMNGSEVRTITFLVTNKVLATHNRQPLAQPAFPVPFHEQVQFQLTTHKAQPILIVDELGRTVDQLTSHIDGTVIWQPASTILPGLYIARTIDGQQLQRLIRQ